MRNILMVGCLTAALSVPSFGVSAMSIMPAIDMGAPPPITRIADGCGAGRYRGAGGYCAGHRVPTVKKVCTARRYRGALVRRCHTYRM